LLIIKTFGISLFYTFACLNLGVLLLHFLIKERGFTSWVHSPTVKLASAFFLGQGLLASLWVLIALGGWFSPLVVFAVCVFCILSGFPFLRSVITDSLCQIKEIWKNFLQEIWVWQIIIALTAALCLFGIFSFGRPPAWDAVCIYSVWPQVIAASHKLTPYVRGYVALGLQGEMHFAALISLGSLDAAKMFSWPTVLAGALMLAAIGARSGLGRRAQWVSLMMIFTSTGVTLLIGDGKTDLFALGLGLAAIYWLLSPSNLSLVGLFLGLAVIAKPTYLFVLLPVLAVLLIWQQAQKSNGCGWKGRAVWVPMLGIIVKQVLWIGAWSLVGIIPHLIKNYALLGNALATSWTNSIGWHFTDWLFPPWLVFRFLLTFPFSTVYGSYPSGQYGNLSFLVLAFFPLWVLLPRAQSKSMIMLTIAAIVGMLTYAIVIPQQIWPPRYYLAVLLLFTLPASRAAEYVYETDSGSRWLAGGVLICLLAGALLGFESYLTTSVSPKLAIPYMTGTKTLCDRDGTSCLAEEAINNKANLGERVYTYYTPIYWFRPDLLQCLSPAWVTPTASEELPRDKTENKLWPYLYEHDFHFILYANNNILDQAVFSPPAWVELDLLYDDGNLKAYHLNYNNSPFQKKFTCRQITPPAWNVIELESGNIIQ